jgi:hypothetical protein
MGLLTCRAQNAMFPCVQRRTFLISAIAILAPRQTEPWLGTWRLNPARSGNRAESSPYKRQTCRIEPWEDGLKVTYEMVGTRGGVTHLEWTGKFDGKDYPMQGVDTVLTNAYRKIDDHSYEIVIKMDGAVVATAKVVVSPDGKTMDVATEQKDASGKRARTAAVYEKQ